MVIVAMTAERIAAALRTAGRTNRSSTVGTLGYCRLATRHPRCRYHLRRIRFGRTILCQIDKLWETDGMKKPELTDMAWLGPKDEMDRASHRFGKCSECHEIICVEKAVTDGPSTQGKTSEMLYEAFRAHVKLKHSEDFNLAAIPATERHQA